MQFQHAFFAKFAEVGPDGSFTAVGAGFDTINFIAPPFVIPHLTLLARFTVAAEECGTPQTLHFELIGVDGEELIAQADARSVPIRPTNPPDRDPEVTFSVSIGNFTPTTVGAYSFRLSRNGVQLCQKPLYIVQATPGENQ